jgi:hypothetical protein
MRVFVSRWLSSPAGIATGAGETPEASMKNRQHLGWLILTPALLLALLVSGCRSREEGLRAMASHLEGDFGEQRGHIRALDISFCEDQERKRPTTVRQALIDIGARLRGREVIDAKGRVLYFCEMREYFWRGHGREEWRGRMEDLENQYHVIRMYVGSPPKD